MTDEAIPDSVSFHNFEHAGWESIPLAYHNGFGDLTTQAIEPLLEAAAVGKGARVLDIATGPGYVAAAAARRGAEVVGIDFSAAMIEQARKRYPGLVFWCCDAVALPFGAQTFDVALMNFGMLHLSQPEKAIGEASRVLRRGGRFAFTVWAKPEEAAGFETVLEAIGACGATNVGLPEGPPFFRFSEPSECVRALLEAGFESARVTKVSQTWRLRDGDHLFEIMKDGTVRTAGLLRAQTAGALVRIRARIREEAERYRRGAVIELPMPAVLAVARKPAAPALTGEQ